jgi:pimeloyl-ACP methyl ester carboxylesterase
MKERSEKTETGGDPCAWARTEWVNLDGRQVRLFAAPPDGSSPSEPPDGPLRLPLLFVHGLGCSGATWEPTVREMANRGLACAALAPDMPGYGHSDGPSGAMGMEDLADWLVRLLDRVGVSRTHVVGNSMGCQVAMAMARRHGERIGGLVLQGPTTGDRLVPPWRYITGLAADTVHENPMYTLRLIKMYTQMGPLRYLATVRKMMEDDPLTPEHLSAVRMPCLVIRGGRDAIVSEHVARRLAAALPDGVYLPLDSAAHAIEFNNPCEFVDAVLTFLARAEAKIGLPTTPDADSSASPEREPVRARTERCAV